MAELLVRAQKHYLDDLTPVQVSALPVNKKLQYDARTEIGDIICVQPDGWTWGREECLPVFIVIKFPGISVDLVKQYQQKLKDTSGLILKRRKFRIPPLVVLSYVQAGNSVVTIALNKIAKFRDDILVKTS